MRCDLICGRCKSRWKYDGPSPWMGLTAHQREKHADEDLGRSPLDGDQVVDVGANEAPTQLALPASAGAAP